MAKKPLVTIGDITTFGNRLRQSIISNLQWSTKLRNSVTLERGETDGTVTSISITVGARGVDESGNPLTGMAAAYEYGSGLHRTKGLAAKYKISARKAPYLFFVSPGYTSPFIGKSVMHPGVEQREYLRKSYEAIRARATDELRQSVRRNIIDSLNITIKEINRK
jgi:hypothetical protein